MEYLYEIGFAVFPVMSYGNFKRTRLGGVNDDVYAIALNGSDVYVGGLFTFADAYSKNRIATWNGSSWSALGSGIDGTVYAIAASGSDLYVGGFFSSAGGNSAPNITKWNGSSWPTWSSGTSGTVRTLAINWDSGEMLVGGQFSTAGSVSANRIAKFTDSENPLPIELHSLTARMKNDRVQLTWQTISEVNNYGFEVQRKSSTHQSNWASLGFIPGSGNSNSMKSYSYIDNYPQNGKSVYRLKQIDNDGRFNFSNEIEIQFVPEKFALHQNYPNPFNPSTKIRYTIPDVISTAGRNLNVSLKVFDALGNEVATLVNEYKAAGRYEIEFNASQLSSGVYFVRMQAGSYAETKKMILIR